MGNELTKKYGLFTAIAMVVGIVIGSGVGRLNLLIFFDKIFTE